MDINTTLEGKVYTNQFERTTLQKTVKNYQNGKYKIPTYQRKAGVWGKQMKENLIGTLFNTHGIIPPLLFIERTGLEGTYYNICDGLQRIHTITQFFNDKVKVPRYVKKFGGLTASQIKDSYPIVYNTLCERPFDINIIKGDLTGEDEILIFIQQQEGERLTLGEKVFANNGMLKNTIKELIEHPIFTKDLKIYHTRCTDYAIAMYIRLILDYTCDYDKVWDFRNNTVIRYMQENPDDQTLAVYKKELTTILDFIHKNYKHYYHYNTSKLGRGLFIQLFLLCLNNYNAEKNELNMDEDKFRQFLVTLSDCQTDACVNFRNTMRSMNKVKANSLNLIRQWEDY